MKHGLALLGASTIVGLLGLTIDMGIADAHTAHAYTTASCPGNGFWTVTPHITATDNGTWTTSPPLNADGTWHVNLGTASFASFETFTYPDGFVMPNGNTLEQITDRPQPCQDSHPSTTTSTTIIEVVPKQPTASTLPPPVGTTVPPTVETTVAPPASSGGVAPPSSSAPTVPPGVPRSVARSTIAPAPTALPTTGSNAPVMLALVGALLTAGFLGIWFGRNRGEQ